MLYMELIAVCAEIYKNVYSVGQNIECVNVKPGGT